MSEVEQLIKKKLFQRASLRGLKKCTACGFINGQRALICRNVNCDLRMKRLGAIRPFDPIQLVTYNNIKLFSLRSKEKLLKPRNFVSITECKDSYDTRLCAFCYVDNCKYDPSEPAHLVCRHIKACKVLSNVAVAEVYPIDKSILWNLNIPAEQKQHLWELFQKEEKIIHPVQKINSSIFVVKCEESNIFPAGCLHVTISSSKTTKKSGHFSCSCKRLKIMLEPDNSVIMKKEICDHLMLLLAAILNKPEGKKLYGQFLDLLQYLWMPTSLNTPVLDCVIRPSHLMDYDLSLEKYNKTNNKIENTEDSRGSSDIFNFTEELFAENNIPDFSDIDIDINNEKNSEVKNSFKPKCTITSEIHIKDPKFNAVLNSIKDEEMDLNFPHFKSTEYFKYLDEPTTQTSVHFNENSLSVIDQFQLSHNMQVSNDHIDLAKDIECFNNMDCIPKQNSLLKTISKNIGKTEDPLTTPSIIMNSFKSPAKTSVPKSFVLKQGPVKIIKIGAPIKTFPEKQSSEIVQKSKIWPNKIILLKSKQHRDAAEQIMRPVTPQINLLKDDQRNTVPLPSLTYESWLDNAIEVLNENVTIQDSPSIKSTFNVPTAFFNYFSKTFSLSCKRNIPNKTTVVKNGKYKNHIKYAWCFNQASAVQRIFATKNMNIELERFYQRLPNGNYELFIPTKVKFTNNLNFRTIYPKVQLYKAFIQFNNNPEICPPNLQFHKCGLRLEWLPSAFPKSNFGLMTIEFYVSVKEPTGTM